MTSSQNEYENIVFLSLFFCVAKSLTIPQPPTLPFTSVSAIDRPTWIIFKSKSHGSNLKCRKDLRALPRKAQLQLCILVTPSLSELIFMLMFLFFFSCRVSLLVFYCYFLFVPHAFVERFEKNSFCRHWFRSKELMEVIPKFNTFLEALEMTH